jgi:ABC-type branched-subunit amino acid transport system substrate-binding protein
MKVKFFAFLFCLFLIGNSVVAQNIPRHKIALFAPLYLDSAFDATDTYRFGTTFPKYLNPGLEFYQGAQAALDSLAKKGAPIEVFVYDTKSTSKLLAQQLAAPEMSGIELMIGHTSATETRTLAEAADRNKVPFVSATLPNDAGVTSNPYYIVLNSTLRSHCEGIYRYLQKAHSGSKITVFTRQGAQEAMLKEYLQDFAKATTAAPLKLSFVDASNGLTAAQLASSLDSTRRNICIAGSLDENFGTALVQQLSTLHKTYPLTIIGMPTWDGLNFSKAGFKSVEIIYTTPFYYARTTPLSTRLTTEFNAKQASRPTDMFYRGYETTLRFALLLLDTKKDIASNLSRKGNTVFTAFDIQPVFLNKQKMELDYFENKKLYFIRVTNGVKNVANL